MTGGSHQEMTKKQKQSNIEGSGTAARLLHLAESRRNFCLSKKITY